MTPLMVITQLTFFMYWEYKITPKPTLCQPVMVLPLMPLKHVSLNGYKTASLAIEASSKNIKMKTNMQCTFIKCYFQTS